MALRFVMVLALAVPSALAFGGDEHNHEASVEAAPHGGLLRDAGHIKAEAVLTGDEVKLYFYDKQLKPKTLTFETLAGEVEFPKQKRKPVSFKKSGETYVAKIDGISKTHRYDLHVKFKDDGKEVLVDFGVDNI